MLRSATRNVCGSALLALLALAAHADKPAQAAAPPEGALPKPGPEHAMLAKDVGTWDATVEMLQAPDAPPTVSKGTEVNTLLGGLWVVSDFKSELMGQPFSGHGVMGYDPVKKKFVGTWVDSMSLSLSVNESTYDAATRTLTGHMEGPGPDGQTVRMRLTTVWKDEDTRLFTMWTPGPGGKEVPGLRITYKRRK